MHAVRKWKQFQAVNKCSAAQQLHVHEKSSTLMGEIAMLDDSGSADRLGFVGHSRKMLI